mgnify:CR=1 FL=1
MASWQAARCSPAAFRRLCVETQLAGDMGMTFEPAAFRRLCVETMVHGLRLTTASQPPSGGCVLKLPLRFGRRNNRLQPPSGGCVLKHLLQECHQDIKDPATFRRLCVETATSLYPVTGSHPAAFRRLCVETTHKTKVETKSEPAQPPSGGCVLKQQLETFAKFPKIP